MLLAAPALGKDPPHIEVDAADSPLLIRGSIGEEPGFVGAMRLHGVGDVGTFRVLFSDLKQEGGEEVVPRAHISLLGEASLSDDEYEDVQVKVEGPPGPGTALRLVDAFSGLSAGFWLCERVRFRVGVEVVLTLCNA
jgi:hypothetical protein